MVRRAWWLALAALGAAAAACGVKPGQDPANAVQGFLAAVQRDDRTAFETHLDRAAVRRDMRAQIIDLGRAAGIEVDGGPSEFTLNRMIAPSNIRLVQAADGQPLPAALALEQVRPLVRKLDGQHVCLHDLTPNQACVLTFEKQEAGKDEGGAPHAAGWRLIKMPATMLTVVIPAAPAKKG
jgi:hypothetical protein